MAELSREVGLGLAARGAASDAVEWATRALHRGLHSVWIHDSYFEREAVTYASAIASQVPEIRVAMGAVNPFTRHPVVLAMTVSSLDDMAPGRIILGLGSALPLRLSQMGIPYTPQEGHDRVSVAIDTLRALWRGERVLHGGDGVPPVEPMFAPVHHVPIWPAARATATWPGPWSPCPRSGPWSRRSAERRPRPAVPRTPCTSRDTSSRWWTRAGGPR